jgi:hypothetical protein
MAGATGHDGLDQSGRATGQPVGVVLGLDITGDHRNAELLSQRIEGAFEQCRFPGPRG